MVQQKKKYLILNRKHKINKVRAILQTTWERSGLKAETWAEAGPVKARGTDGKSLAIVAGGCTRSKGSCDTTSANHVTKSCRSENDKKDQSIN